MPLSHVQTGDARWEFVPSQPVPCFSGIRPKRGLEPCDATPMEENRYNEQMDFPAKRVCIREQIDLGVDEGLPGCLKDSPPTSSLSSSHSTNHTLSSSSTPAYLPSMVDGYHNNYNNHNAIHSINNTNGSTLPPITEDKSFLDHLNHSDGNNNNDDLMMEEDCIDNSSNAFTNYTLSSSTSAHNHTSKSNMNSSSLTMNGHAASVLNTQDHSTSTTSMETGLDIEARSSSSAAGVSSSTSSNSDKSAYCGYSSCRGLKPSPVSGRWFCHCYASWRGMYGMEGAYFNDYY